MGKGGDKVQNKKISLEELSKHRTPPDGTQIILINQKLIISDILIYLYINF